MKNTTLVPISNQIISGNEIQTVNARELHSFLGSKTKFPDWIKNRIEDYGFVEGEDFFLNLGKTPNGGRPRREYYLTLDTAKELSMVERNDRGREARRYFIECEKKLKNRPPEILSRGTDPEILQINIDHFIAHALEVQQNLEKTLSMNSEALNDIGRVINTFCLMFPDQVQRMRGKAV